MCAIVVTGANIPVLMSPCQALKRTRNLNGGDFGFPLTKVRGKKGSSWQKYVENNELLNITCMMYTYIHRADRQGLDFFFS